jgi:hypothetical protein
VAGRKLARSAPLTHWSIHSIVPIDCTQGDFDMDVTIAESTNGNGKATAATPKAAALHAAARELIQRGEPVAAYEMLRADNEGEAETQALVGLSLFLQEKYEEAKAVLEPLMARAPRPEWRELLARTKETLETHSHHQHPPYRMPDPAVWLGPPAPAEGVLPPPPVQMPQRSEPFKRLRRALSVLVGRGASLVLERVTPLTGRWLGTADEVWTNWYHRPVASGLMVLAYMREQLNKNNLKDPYPTGALTAFQPTGMSAPASAKYYRTADGSWNNLTNPREGAAYVRFPRNVNRAATWPKKHQLMTPNPAEISQSLFVRSEQGMKPVPFLNLLAACWIQFNIHDWVSHRSGREMGLYEIPLPPDHPARIKYHQTKMFVGRTEQDPTRRLADEGTPPTYINEVTSWWDASQIYGSDPDTAKRLRALQGGKLKLDADGRLPKGTWGFEDTGFNRNWWVGLALLHTLFVREHNAICAHLALHYPDWDDNRLYHVARLINAAVIAKIHTVEWTPAILPNPGLHQAMNANWYGLLETNLKKRADRKVFPWLKISNPEVGGIVGNPIDKHGAPYGLSDEFTEIYRLHELLPDELQIRRIADDRVETVTLASAFQVGARTLSDRVSIADLIYSFGNMQPGQLVLHNYPNTLRELSLPGNPVFDLAAVDILRARERGVPRYNEFRRQLGLKPICSFEDLTEAPGIVQELKRLYDNDIEAVDLLVGTRSETTRPTGYGFGETMFQLFILNASRRLQADRFYTDSYNAETYTPEGLSWVDAADFKSVLLRHFPELQATGLANVDNGFEPWDTGALDPQRHPLRAFDR